MRVYSILFSVLLLTASTLHAQSLPVIESFTVDNPALNYAAVEGGTEAANFSWRAVGLRAGDKMQIHALVGGQWALIGEGFDPEKTDRLVIAHPLDYVVPRYRLSVADASGAIVAEQFLDLSYAPPGEPPTISMFLALHPTEVISIRAFDAPFQVQWQVRNRWFNSSIVIEQILADGTILAAEVQRPAWQYAHKADYVNLVYPGDYQDVVLRMRVINRDNGETLVEKHLAMHVDNSPAPAPQLVSFTVSPEVVEPGAPVTLAWEVTNTDAVFIEYSDGNANGSCAGYLEHVYETTPSGMMQITAPEIAYRDLQFRLFADFYVGGSRHNCTSRRTPLAEKAVPLTDFVGQGVDDFRIVPYHAAVGETVTVFWSVTDGESVTIRHAYTDSITESGFVEYTDLPLSGQMEITIPDHPEVRDSFSGYMLLYIIEDGAFPPVFDRSATLLYD